MHLTLLLPGLLLPGPVLRDTAFDLDLPALALMLGRGRRQWSAPASAHGWAAAACGLGGPSGPLPAAALRRLADGHGPDGGDWLCLDPVHLRLEEMRLVVDDPARLGLSPEEDAALRAAVAPLLADLGELEAAGRPGRWHLRLAATAPTVPESPALPEAAGRPADPGHPRDARWRARLAEAQTLLHAHPVNRAREEAGRPTANSLWPWGAGRLPAFADSPFDTLLSADPVLRGLAAHLGLAAGEAVFAPRPGRVLAHLAHLAGPAQALDALAWRDGLAALERDWLAPALAALQAGRCRALRLAAPGEERSLELELSRRDLWRFWRKPLPLQRLT